MVGKRINVSIAPDAGEALQHFYDSIQAKRGFFGEQLMMREVIAACIMHCAAQPEIKLCGEWIENESDCDTGSA